MHRDLDRLRTGVCPSVWEVAIRQAAALAAACASVFVILLAAHPAAAEAGCAHATAAAGEVEIALAARSLRCLVNAERRRHGLRELRASRKLRRAAGRHARDMAGRDFFAHVSPGGADVEDRVRRAGYLADARAWSIGETLAWGTRRSGSPRALLRTLLASPPHRAILLDGRYRHIGIGVARGAPRAVTGAAVTVTLDLALRR
jgi:uncharacterized protein YkwD